MDNATTATKTKKGSQPFKTNFKGMKKIQRVVSLSGKVSKNLDNYCLDNEFKPSEAINYILKDFFDKAIQES